MKPPGDHSFNDPRAQARWQTVENTSWPPADVAAKSRDRDISEWIDVRARVVLQVDGEVWLDGQATRWWQDRVCVLVNDLRLQVQWVWLSKDDVKRR